MSQTQTIEARHTTNDLSVSDVTSREWDKAEPVQIDHYWSGESAPAGRHAEARILWSKAALHIRYVCDQAEPLVVSDSPKTAKKTMQL